MCSEGKRIAEDAQVLGRLPPSRHPDTCDGRVSMLPIKCLRCLPSPVRSSYACNRAYSSHSCEYTSDFRLSSTLMDFVARSYTWLRVCSVAQERQTPLSEGDARLTHSWL